jgi:hypothetical protein
MSHRLNPRRHMRRAGSDPSRGGSHSPGCVLICQVGTPPFRERALAEIGLLSLPGQAKSMPQKQRDFRSRPGNPAIVSAPDSPRGACSKRMGVLT